MLNVEQITSNLAKLPDAALQRYAMLHKDDPYVLSLALSEANRRKDMRSGAQMQAQPQPKVVDQALAGMAPQQQPPLPENVGIGALPAQNIQGMADGGIVGYADGGYNPASGPAGRLAYDNEPVLRMAGGGIVAFDGGGRVSQNDVQKAYDAWMAAKPSWFSQQTPTSAQREQDAEAEYIRLLHQYQTQPSMVQPSGAPMAGAAPAAAPQLDTVPFNAMTATRRDMYQTQPERPPAPLPADAAAQQAPRKPVMPAANPLVEQVLGGRKALGIDDQAEFSREQARAEREKYMGDNPAKAQLERLNKLDQMAQNEREDARNFSLLRAGLRILASKSPYGMVGIGEGGAAELTSYESALKELKAAERDREKLRQTAENALYEARAGNYDKVDAQYEKWLDRKEKKDDRLMQVYGQLKSTEMQGQSARDVANIHRKGQDAYTQAVREGQLENRNMMLVERIRSNIEAKVLAQPQFMTDPVAANAEVERRLQAELKRYPALAQYAGTPTGGGAAQTGQWGQMTTKPTK